MKRTVYTLAFVALFSVLAKSQSTEQPKKEEAVNKEALNPDGTLAPAQSSEDAKKAEEPKKSGTRMAITEKGVPASKKQEAAKTQKATEPKKSEPSKAEKH